MYLTDTTFIRHMGIPKWIGGLQFCLKDVTWQWFCCIMWKFGHIRSSNSKDYEVTNAWRAAQLAVEPNKIATISSSCICTVLHTIGITFRFQMSLHIVSIVSFCSFHPNFHFIVFCFFACLFWAWGRQPRENLSCDWCVVGKLLLMLQSVKRGFAVDRYHPQLHECLVHFLCFG